MKKIIMFLTLSVVLLFGFEAKTSDRVQFCKENCAPKSCVNAKKFAQCEKNKCPNFGSPEDESDKTCVGNFCKNVCEKGKCPDLATHSLCIDYCKISPECDDDFCSDYCTSESCKDEKIYKQCEHQCFWSPKLMKDCRKTAKKMGFPEE